MIGGVFLLARDPASLAGWYHKHLGWQLAPMSDGTHFIELYYREADRREVEQHLVCAIMLGDPGEPGKATSSTTGSTTSAVVAGRFTRLPAPSHRIELWQHFDV